MEIGQYSAEQLVFVDESAVDRRTPHRRYGWAPSGERAEMHDHFVRGGRFVMIPRQCSGPNQLLSNQVLAPSRIIP